MTNRQENKFSMFLAVRNYLLKHDVLPIPAYIPAKEAFLSTLSEIQAIREQQELNKTGITERKKQIREILVANALDLCRRMTAYARVEKNVVLMQEINYNYSHLMKSPDTVLRDKCRVIYAKAGEHISSLLEYGVNEKTLSGFSEQITSYHNAISSPRLGIVEKKQATQQLQNLFERCREEVFILDALVETERSSNLNFYIGYISARKTIRTGEQRMALRCRASEAGSGAGIPGVLFRILPEPGGMAGNPTAQTVSIEKKTFQRGSFFIRSLAPGNYEAIAQKAGYKEVQLRFIVTEEEMASVEAKMEQE